MRHLLLYKYVEAIAKVGSIRKASELLAITPSALNRRLLALEEELGMPIFERLPSGVRLNTAGEILLEHIRNQMSDLERVKSQIADLSGVRRGHVRIAASPEALGSFLISQVRQYRQIYPGVSFGVDQYLRGAAESSLIEHDTDIAFVFEPIKLADFQIVMNMRQPIMCLMRKDHPLAGKKALRLYECAEFEMNLPEASWGIGFQLEQAALKLGLNLRSSVRSNSQEFLRNYSGSGDELGFDIPINLQGSANSTDQCVIPLDQSDVPEGFLFVGHLKGRALPVAAARFLEQLTGSLDRQFD